MGHLVWTRGLDIRIILLQLKSHGRLQKDLVLVYIVEEYCKFILHIYFVEFTRDIAKSTNYSKEMTLSLLRPKMPLPLR